MFFYIWVLGFLKKTRADLVRSAVPRDCVIHGFGPHCAETLSSQSIRVDFKQLGFQINLFHYLY